MDLKPEGPFRVGVGPSRPFHASTQTLLREPRPTGPGVEPGCRCRFSAVAFVNGTFGSGGRLLSIPTHRHYGVRLVLRASAPTSARRRLSDEATVSAEEESLRPRPPRLTVTSMKN